MTQNINQIKKSEKNIFNVIPNLTNNGDDNSTILSGAQSPFAIDTFGEHVKFFVSQQACYGGIYDGEVNAQGKMHGYGRKMLTVGPLKGAVYEGEWKDNIQCGQGIMTYAHGGQYVGGWKNDREFGEGVMSHPNGDVYTGVWTDSGDSNGEMRRVDGSVLRGKYRVLWYGAGSWSYEV